MTRRSLQAPLAVLLLAGGMLLSVATGRGTIGSGADPTLPSALDAPMFSIDLRPGHIRLRGTTASAAHESGLLRLVAEQFRPHEVQTDFTPGVVLAADWAPMSTRLLYVLAATESAHAIMRNDAIEIRGATLDAETFAARAQVLRNELPVGAALLTDVVTISSPTPQEALCRRAFARLSIQPISFRQSSAEIRTSSYSILDRIVDFANDCRELEIAVTGHTDAAGDETWNRRLSLQRAQAVADYLVKSGIDACRLQVRGLGAAAPIADNATPQGRSRNRRIEFTLL